MSAVGGLKVGVSGIEKGDMILSMDSVNLQYYSFLEPFDYLLLFN